MPTSNSSQATYTAAVTCLLRCFATPQAQTQASISVGYALLEQFNGTARGTGVVQLAEFSMVLFVDITVTGLTGQVTGAFVQGPAGPGVVSNVVVADVSLEIVGNSYHTKNTFINLSPAQVDWAVRGLLYINISTTAFPSGQVRGQIQMSGVGCAVLGAGGESPTPAVSNGTGTAALELLSPNSLFYDITVSGLTSAITMAHFHGAPFLQNGGVLFPIPFSANGRAMCVWANITAVQMAALVSGQVYINVHTTVYGGGEVRGQVLGLQPTSFGAAALTGVFSGTTAVGTGTFAAKLLEVSGTLWYSLALNNTNPTANLSVRIYGPNDVTLQAFKVPAVGRWGRRLSSSTVVQLLKNNSARIDVHSGNPGEDFGGQISFRGVGSSIVTGVSEIPPNNSSGVAAGLVAVYGPSNIFYQISVSGLSSAVTKLHFHGPAVPTVAAPMLYDLSNSMAESGQYQGVLYNVAPDVVQQFLSGQVYINVHTANIPGGELRGQVAGVMQQPTPFDACSLAQSCYMQEQRCFADTVSTGCFTQFNLLSGYIAAGFCNGANLNGCATLFAPTNPVSMALYMILTSCYSGCAGATLRKLHLLCLLFWCLSCLISEQHT